MPDPFVETSLDNFGFAQVLVTIKAPKAARTLAAKRDLGGKILKHFLDRVPQAAGGAAASFAARASKRATPAARHFPRLGVALGYVDRQAMSRLNRSGSVGEVHHAGQLSLIRPVAARASKGGSGLTWGLRRLGVEAIWAQGLTGEGVRVGHLDTGVDGKHPALRKRIAEFMETDRTGNRIAGASPHDSDDHGTHTAGTICGEKSGGLSIGVAPKAELYSGLVIEGGQVLLRVLEGMEWALEKRVRVLNMSLGFRGFTPFFLDVTQRLREEGVLPVFAIGNEGVGTSRSPGNYAEALSVGAIDRRSRIATFSSSISFDRPQEPNQPNVVAPGVSVISAKPGGGVQSMDGTSMATPHVAGVAALLFQARPQSTVEEVEHAIQSTCAPLPGGDELRFGFGQVRPAEALASLTGTPVPSRKRGKLRKRLKRRRKKRRARRKRS